MGIGMRMGMGFARTLAPFGFRFTIRAGTVKNNFVVFDAKLWRSHFFEPFETFFELKDLAALATKKMMMMPFVSALVSRRLSRNFNRNDLPVFGKRFERTVDCRNPERWHLEQCLL